VHRDVQERDGPAKDCRQHGSVVEALRGPAFARAARSREPPVKKDPVARDLLPQSGLAGQRTYHGIPYPWRTLA
jgi:hypothetical protein